MSDVVLEQRRAALSGTYRFEREPGQGGMATVYLAHDRDVAMLVTGPRDTTTSALTVVIRWVERLPAHGAKP